MSDVVFVLNISDAVCLVAEMSDKSPPESLLPFSCFDVVEPDVLVDSKAFEEGESESFFDSSENSTSVESSFKLARFEAVVEAVCEVVDMSVVFDGELVFVVVVDTDVEAFEVDDEGDDDSWRSSRLA